MKSTQGIAIVTTLLVGASVLILSFGTMFLTRADLTIGDNVRANTLAKYRAQLIFESSLIALQHEADANGTLPETFTAPRLHLVGEDAGEWVASDLVYTQLSPEQALLKAKGRGPREASFMSEGVLELGSLSQVTEPMGLSAGGSVTIGNWANTRISDAHIHGNAGYTFAELDLSKLGACSSRDLAGLCSIWSPYDMSVDADADGIPDNLKVTAAESLSAYACAPAGNASLCEMLAGSPAPRQRQTALSLELDTNELLAVRLSVCDQSYASPPTLSSQADVDAIFKAGQTVCVSGGDLTFPSGVVLDGVRAIAEDGDIQMSGGSVVNSSIIAKNGGLNLGSVSVDSSFLYSRSHLSLPASVTLQGQTDVVSGAGLDFAAAANPSSIDGPSVGVRVHTQGDIRYASASDVFVYFASGGSFKVESSACILGSVEAALDIDANGGICLDAGLAQDEAAPVDTSVRVVSRR